jgi:tetratricopeptide (TPR) repeat protein
MSKNRARPTKSKKTLPLPTAKVPVAASRSPQLPPVTPHDPLLEKLFRFSALGMLAVALLLALGSGINGDDEYQNDYSKKLVDYYLSAGSDTAALYIEKGNMHYYGGFFDLTVGLANRALGFDEFDAGYHHVRHVFNVLMGMLAILFTGLLAREIGGWRAGLLALWLIFLSPRFLGHSLMNPKDIPFAAGFAIATYYMVLLLRAMPRPGWKPALGLALGMALALATRAGGLLLFAYLFLFAALDFLFKYGFKGLVKEWDAVWRYAAYALGISLAAYALAVVTWPAALADPLRHPLAALTEFAKLGVKIRLLFMGENVMSDATAWYYPVLWIAKTIPLYALVGFGASLLLLPVMLKRYSAVAVLLVYFAAIFPVAYVIRKESILHDGWRHLMFVYPSIVVAASLFWAAAEDLLKSRRPLQYALYGLLALLAVDAIAFIVRNPQYPYVYFNPIGGGIKGAFGNYETDYWGVSVKQAIDWLDQEGIISPGMQDTVVIGTTFFYNVSRQTRKKYDGKVKTVYVRFNSRYNEAWDYGLFPSRFIRGPHLRAGTWPNSRSIHAVKANGVPLLSIEKDADKFAFRGQQAINRQDWLTAVQEFQQEVQAQPDNELAWIGLSNAYLSMGQYAPAQDAAEKALVAAPDTESALLYRGLAALNQGNSAVALDALLRAVRVNEEYSFAHYYLALIYEQTQDPRSALDAAQKAIQYSPNFKAAYELVARVLRQLGDEQNARAYEEAARRL